MITRSHCDAFPVPTHRAPKKTDRIGPRTRRKIIGGVVALVPLPLSSQTRFSRRGHIVRVGSLRGEEKEMPAQSEQKTCRCLSGLFRARTCVRTCKFLRILANSAASTHLGQAKIANRGQSHRRFDQLSFPTSHAWCSIQSQEGIHGTQH